MIRNFIPVWMFGFFILRHDDRPGFNSEIDPDSLTPIPATYKKELYSSLAVFKSNGTF